MSLSKNLIERVLYSFKYRRDNFPDWRRKKLITMMHDPVHIGRRSFCAQVMHKGEAYAKKTFAADETAMACHHNELLAYKLFMNHDWMPPLTKQGERALLRPWYPEELRLDTAVKELDSKTRQKIAYQAIEILFEIFLRGYAHRDFNAQNLFFVDGQLKVIDFELMEKYAEQKRPAFPFSYDVIGENLGFPLDHTGSCSYIKAPPGLSLQEVLGVQLEEALGHLKQGLKDQLNQASRTFARNGARHTCRAQRIYSSFELSHLKVSPDEAQRNCSRRLQVFGITGREIEGKRLLDLGSNIGGMVFQAHNLKPKECLGVECDIDKVILSEEIAAFNGLNNVRFIEGDIDKLDAKKIGGPFDIVFCLAVEAHVKNPNRLYKLLAEVTTDTVYFEGNAGTNPENAREKLLSAGFSSVRMLGVSDDDCIPDNNIRPILIGKK